MEELEKLSPCGAAKLLASIFRAFGADEAKLRVKFGVPPPPKALCPQCGKPPPRKGKVFCSKECRHSYYQILCICEECGDTFTRKQSSLIYAFGEKNRKHLFCNKKCLGRFVGRTYGFVAHPENCGGGNHNGAPRKWDWDLIAELQEKTSWRAEKLRIALRIPSSTFYAILKKQKASKMPLGERLAEKTGATTSPP